MKTGRCCRQRTRVSPLNAALYLVYRITPTFEAGGKSAIIAFGACVCRSGGCWRCRLCRLCRRCFLPVLPESAHHCASCRASACRFRTVTCNRTQCRTPERTACHPARALGRSRRGRCRCRHRCCRSGSWVEAGICLRPGITLVFILILLLGSLTFGRVYERLL